MDEEVGFGACRPFELCTMPFFLLAGRFDLASWFLGSRVLLTCTVIDLEPGLTDEVVEPSESSLGVVHA